QRPTVLPQKLGRRGLVAEELLAAIHEPAPEKLPVARLNEGGDLLPQVVVPRGVTGRHQKGVSPRMSAPMDSWPLAFFALRRVLRTMPGARFFGGPSGRSRRPDALW